MNGTGRTYKWHAVYTITNHEKKVHEYLVSHGIESFLPVTKILKKWSDRKKWIDEPLFPSYVFVKVSNREYVKVLSHSSSLKYVCFESVPAIISDHQIEDIKRVIESGYSYEKTNQTFDPGQLVRISAGPFYKYTGEIINTCGNNRLILRIESIGYSLLVHIPQDHVLRRS